MVSKQTKTAYYEKVSTIKEFGDFSREFPQYLKNSFNSLERCLCVMNHIPEYLFLEHLF